MILNETGFRPALFKKWITDCRSAARGTMLVIIYNNEIYYLRRNAKWQQEFFIRKIVIYRC